jgi:hypothetical protein
MSALAAAPQGPPAVAFTCCLRRPAAQVQVQARIRSMGPLAVVTPASSTEGVPSMPVSSRSHTSGSSGSGNAHPRPVPSAQYPSPYCKEYSSRARGCPLSPSTSPNTTFLKARGS